MPEGKQWDAKHEITALSRDQKLRSISDSTSYAEGQLSAEVLKIEQD